MGSGVIRVYSTATRAGLAGGRGLVGRARPERVDGRARTIGRLRYQVRVGLECECRVRMSEVLWPRRSCSRRRRMRTWSQRLFEVGVKGFHPPLGRRLVHPARYAGSAGGDM